MFSTHVAIRKENQICACLFVCLFVCCAKAPSYLMIEGLDSIDHGFTTQVLII